MDEATARAKLADMTAATVFPVLSVDTMDRLISEYAREDVDGLAPTDVGWTGTWDFNRAAADAWRVKAGMVSNRHTFGSNQGNYNPEQVFEHCMKMAEYYVNKTVGAVVLASGRWDGAGRLNSANNEDAV